MTDSVQSATISSGTIDQLNNTSLLGPNFHPDTLTADSLFAYLTARLGNFDNRIDEIFKRQQKADAVRSALREISTALSRLHENPDKPTAKDSEVHSAEEATSAEVKTQVYYAIQDQLSALDKLDPELAGRLRKDLEAQDGLLHLLSPNRNPLDGDAMRDVNGHVLGTYTGQAVKSAKELVGNISKDLDASAQLDMIQLQSLTSARQTAVGLATNLLSSLSETLRSITANIGK